MDYSHRIKSVQNYLKEHDLDAFLVLTKINRQYLSGFTGSKGVLLIASPSLTLPTRLPDGQARGREMKKEDSSPLVGEVRRGGGAVLFVDERYTIRAKKESGLQVRNIKNLNVIAIPPRREKQSRRDRRVRSRRTRDDRKIKIGIEDEITLHQFSKLKKEIKGVKWQVTRRVVDHIRARKSPAELRAIRKGAKIIDATFEHIVQLLKKRITPSPTLPTRGRERGVRGSKKKRSSPLVGEARWGEELRESDIAREIISFGKKHGADGPAFDPIVAFGSNAAAPHHASSTTRKIGRNNFLLLDFGFVVDGYHSDFTRTLFIGKPNKRQERVYNTVHGAQQTAIQKIRSGIKSSSVDKAVRDCIEKAGFGKNFTHCSGHGVGLEIHEAPNLCPDSDEVLPENAVVTVEPGVYIEGWGGIRIEDMVVVEKKGAKVFSSIPKDLKGMIIN